MDAIDKPEVPAPGPPKSKRGGARPGSGRKPNAEKQALLKAQALVTSAQEKRSAQLTAEEIEKQEDLAERVEQEIPLAVAVTIARKRIGEQYPYILDSLFTLMNGGEQRVQKYEKAALVLVDTYTEPDDKGRQSKVKVQAFPNRDPEEMVLVSETITTYPPDSAVTQFLFNRLAGKPSEEKVNPLDESGEEKPVVTREEMFMDFMDFIMDRVSQRRQPAPASAVAAALTQ